MNQISPSDKFQILEKTESNMEVFSGSSFGVYFEFKSESHLIVHFKPLNEEFKTELFNENKGILISYERDLIDEDDIEYALDVMMLFNKSPYFSLTDPDEVKQLQTIIEFLKEEYARNDCSYIMLKTLLKVLMLHLIRFRNQGFLKQDLNQKRVFQFLELMEKHFLEETDTHFYAEKIRISSKRLNQILKEKLHLTAKQIIHQRQLTEAKRRLVRSEITTKELAFLLGFDSISSFSRFFKKHLGMSPSTFRSQF